MTEITDKMIGCLCWFKNKEDKKSIVGILKGITSDNCYVNDFWCKSEECRPVKPDEVKLYDDNRYNCCSENEELRLKVVKLEEENKKTRKHLDDLLELINRR